jgi:Protein of unknown function (DUF3224)
VTRAQGTFEKQFHGYLKGASRGEMLTAMTGVKGSAGYVAMERVTGALDGRSGSFVLQHSGIMARGVPRTDHHRRAGFRDRAVGRNHGQHDHPD